MLTPDLLATLARTYPETFLRWCRAPEHCRPLSAFHARGEHRAANGDWIEFRLRLADGVIVETGFTFEGRPVLLAAGEAVCQACVGLTVTAALAACSEEAIAAELGSLPDSDCWSLAQVSEALRACLLDALAVARHPWKGPYVR